MAAKNLNWDDDLLGRRDNALFLTKLVMQHYENYYAKSESGALCFAVDAEWGAGKSFFMDRWSIDLANEDHPVIHFDAWANDLADEPLIGFLARMKTELIPWAQKQALITTTKASITRKFNGFFRRSGRAIVPVGAVIAGGLVKKYAGFAWDELADAAKSSDSSDSGVGGDTASKAIDAYVQNAMKAHTDRQSAIDDFRTDLSELVDFLVSKTTARAPLIIFIDELDRCRPDYAIKLLEGMKHLFNCRGVCFAVSTNLRQLSASVKAVYGHDFDAYLYLKKFFAFEYALPEPEQLPFARSLIKGSVIEKLLSIDAQRCMSCLPRNYEGENPREGIAHAFALVATGLRLDLRSQQQVFKQAEAALAGYPPKAVIPFLYLFYLAGLRHGGTAKYDHALSVGLLSKELDPNFADTQLTFAYRNSVHQMQEGSTTTYKVIRAIHRFTTKTPREMAQFLQTDMEHYPENLAQFFIDGGTKVSGKDRSPIAHLSELVRLSGYAKLQS